MTGSAKAMAADRSPRRAPHRGPLRPRVASTRARVARRLVVATCGALLSTVCNGCTRCEPGYGTLDLMIAPGDAYTTSVEDKVGENLNLLIFIPVNAEESCELGSNRGREIEDLYVGMTLHERFDVPAGWVCVEMSGGSSVGPTPEGGEPDSISCGGATAPTWVGECDRAKVQVDVACELVPWDGARTASPPMNPLRALRPDYLTSPDSSDHES